MIDIHSHILPNIDDGSDSIEDSLKMIFDEKESGITKIILTPHALRNNIKPYKLDDMYNKFNAFKDLVNSKYGVKLYLGQEISYTDKIITALRKNEVIPLNDTNYLLVELPFNELPNDLNEFAYSCKLLGYEVIIAHVERYNYLSISDIINLKEKYGFLLQINSSSIVSDNKKLTSKVFKLFKKNLISFVASDIHSFRKNTMKEAFEIIKTKLSEEIALNVFKLNAISLLNIND